MDKAKHDLVRDNEEEIIYELVFLNFKGDAHISEKDIEICRKYIDKAAII